MNGNVKKEKKDTKAVKVDLPKDLHKQLKLKAVETEQTIQNVIIALISEWVRK